MEQELQALGQQMAGDLGKVTETWDHKPDFEVEVHMSGYDGEVTVSTDDKVFHWLNGGTAARCAWMEPGFEPKTSFMWLGSQAGQGGVLRDKKGNKVLTRSRLLPGISARKWDEALMEKYKNTPNFGNGVVDSLKNLFLRLIGTAVVMATSRQTRGATRMP